MPHPSSCCDSPGVRTRLCPFLQTYRMGSGAVAKRVRQEMLEQPHNTFPPQRGHFRKPPTRTCAPNCVHEPGERRLLGAQPVPAERGLRFQEGGTYACVDQLSQNPWPRQCSLEGTPCPGRFLLDTFASEGTQPPLPHACAGKVDSYLRPLQGRPNT